MSVWVGFRLTFVGKDIKMKWRKKLMCSLVVRQQIFLYCQAAAEHLASNMTFYAVLATKLYLAV